mmetsp:Transcript_55646/g.131397  ORF Transcript_55646/g.131397 Transcript_55646/m.131397 type:complete len:225 (-) Transcript_55646:73-747(-)
MCCIRGLSLEARNCFALKSRSWRTGSFERKPRHVAQGRLPLKPPIHPRTPNTAQTPETVRTTIGAGVRIDSSSRIMRASSAETWRRSCPKASGEMEAPGLPDAGSARRPALAGRVGRAVAGRARSTSPVAAGRAEEGRALAVGRSLVAGRVVGRAVAGRVVPLAGVEVLGRAAGRAAGTAATWASSSAIFCSMAATSPSRLLTIRATKVTIAVSSSVSVRPSSL